MWEPLNCCNKYATVRQGAIVQRHSPSIISRPRRFPRKHERSATAARIDVAGPPPRRAPRDLRDQQHRPGPGDGTDIGVSLPLTLGSTLWRASYATEDAGWIGARGDAGDHGRPSRQARSSDPARSAFPPTASPFPSRHGSCSTARTTPMGPPSPPRRRSSSRRASRRVPAR